MTNIQSKNIWGRVSPPTFHKIYLALCIVPTLGCTSTISCPTGAKSKVALLDHGRHATIVLNGVNQSYRYGYGDWNYYALGKTGLFQGVRALLWPTKGGLGRKVFSQKISREYLKTYSAEGVESITIFYADSKLVGALKDRLDQLYFSNIKNQIYNHDYDLFFVPHPEDYWIFNQSNEVMARWIEEMGCSVEGVSLWSKWKVYQK